MKQSGLTFIEILVIVFILVAIAAVFVPAINYSRHPARITGCASNLRSLWQSAFNYAAQYGRPDGLMPEATGSDFFLVLQRTPKPLMDRYEPFFCPYLNESPGPGRCSYRGPAFPIRTMKPGDPCAADNEGNHGKGQGGNVLTGTGDVGSYEETDAVWIRARTTTRP